MLSPGTARPVNTGSTVKISLQVVHGAGHFSALEQLEPDFGVFLFVVGSFFKELADLDVTVFFGLGGVVTVFGVGLAFAGKGGQQVGFGFASF